MLDGELEHKASEGNTGVLYPGHAQRMSAGTGIWHPEMNPQTARTCISSRFASPLIRNAIEWLCTIIGVEETADTVHPSIQS